MNRRLSQLTALATVFAPPLLRAAPTEIARESFEGAAGAIGFTTSVPPFEVLAATQNDFFKVVPNNGTKLIGGIISGGDGASMFAGEDLDTSPNNNPATLSVTLNPVNISGKTNPSVMILLAAPGNGPAAGGTQNFYDHSATAADIDLIRVEARIDGGPFTPLIQFAPSNPAPALNAPLSLDTNFDGLGGQGTALTAAFQEFDLPLSTGTSVEVRVVMHSNATNEYLCLDNIRIFGENPATAPPVISGVPAGALVFPEGAAATALAPSLTLSDPDSATLPSASVVITQNLTSGEDVLAATASGAILAGDILYTAATGTLTITRSAPVADYQAVLRSVTYRNTNTTNPATSPRQIRFSTTDGVNASNAPLREVTVTDSIILQNLPFTESFETDGRGSRYSLDGRFTNGTALFDRGQPASTTNLDGTFAIIAEDTQLDAAPVKAVNFLLNTKPFGNVTASVRLGALGGAIFDTGDTIAVEASVDGGPFTNVAAFRSTVGVGGSLALDTDNNGIGDGTQLSSNLQDFTFTLPPAATLGLRIRCQSNSTAERLIVDRIAVQGTPLTFTISSPSVAENSGPLSFTVTRNLSSGADTIDFSTSNGTALAGTDYTTVTGTLNFADGDTTKPVVITVSSDSTVELDETFSVTLSNASRGTITGGPGTGSITNDDASVITLTASTPTEGDTGTAPLTYNIILSNPVDAGISFDRATETTGTATSGTDFTAVAATSTTIAANATTGSFSVNILGDHTPESTETVPVLLSTLSAGGRNVTFAGGGTTLTASGGILDDDPLIVAGAGSLGMGIGVSGKLTTASLLALATGGEGRPLSLVGVQSPTPGGGTVTITDGWIVYQPAAGFSGADSFTYTLTDGFQTVGGTVQVVASNSIGQTMNIVGMTPEGAGKRVVALGIPGRSYQWQTTSNLTDWVALGTPAVCPASGVLSILDPGPLPPVRYYRMVQP